MNNFSINRVSRTTRDIYYSFPAVIFDIIQHASLLTGFFSCPSNPINFYMTP